MKTVIYFQCDSKAWIRIRIRIRTEVNCWILNGVEANEDPKQC
jgi:hypothetical protein